jgi:serine/threonine protein kinase
VQIGLQLVDQLKVLHSCGFVYNDLKPENTLLKSKNARDPKSSQIILIDFGISSSFLNENGKHV